MEIARKASRACVFPPGNRCPECRCVHCTEQAETAEYAQGHGLCARTGCVSPILVRACSGSRRLDNATRESRIAGGSTVCRRSSMRMRQRNVVQGFLDPASWIQQELAAEAAPTRVADIASLEAKKKSPAQGRAFPCIWSMSLRRASAYWFWTFSSVRRFCARPSGLSEPSGLVFGAIGRLSP